MRDYKVFENVELHEKGVIQPNCLIGLPVDDSKGNSSRTVIGPDHVIRSGTVIYSGNLIEGGFQTGHGVLIRENNVIGDNVSVGSGTDVEYEIRIEDDVRIHSQSFIPEYSTLMEGCWIGPNVVLANAKYPRSQGVKENLEGPVIEQNAKIGANATILPGIRVKKNALIGAGSVVTKDVKRGTVAAGVPAKNIGRVEDLRRSSSNGEPIYGRGGKRA